SGVVRGQLECSLFFFQAEDGIRDFHVTGVQTCALPISELAQVLSAFERCQSDAAPILVTVTGPPGIGKSRLRREVLSRASVQARSEERRVGKGCRSRWWSGPVG